MLPLDLHPQPNSTHSRKGAASGGAAAPSFFGAPGFGRQVATHFLPAADLHGHRPAVPTRARPSSARPRGPLSARTVHPALRPLLTSARPLGPPPPARSQFEASLGALPPGAPARPLSCGTFRPEPATRPFDGSFAATPRSRDRFARQTPSEPRARLPPPSLAPGVVHRLSGRCALALCLPGAPRPPPPSSRRSARARPALLGPCYKTGRGHPPTTPQHQHHHHQQLRSLPTQTFLLLPVASSSLLLLLLLPLCCSQAPRAPPVSRLFTPLSRVFSPFPRGTSSLSAHPCLLPSMGRPTVRRALPRAATPPCGRMLLTIAALPGTGPSPSLARRPARSPAARCTRLRFAPGPSPFARRYSGNPCSFLLLRVLICLSPAGPPTRPCVPARCRPLCAPFRVRRAVPRPDGPGQNNCRN